MIDWDIIAVKRKETAKNMKSEDNLKLRYVGTTAIFSVLGEIDHHSAKVIKNAVDAELLVKRPDALVLDLSAVNFMDSSGLGLILGRYQSATKLGIEFSLYEPTEAVMKLLKIAGCDRIINITRRNKNGKESKIS